MTLPPHGPGSTWCECAGCGSGFGGLTLFDKHRVGQPGERRCLTADEITARGWHQDDRGLWKAAAPATMAFAGVSVGANRGVAAKSRVSGPDAPVEAA